MFNPYEKYHTHLFSADKKELEDNIKRGWKDEQVRWYVPGKPAEATPSATDTDVNVSTGPGPSHAKEPKKPTTTPVLTEEQKTILAEYLKPVSELVAATRTSILKGGKTPEEAVQALQTKANEAKTNAENLKKQADATGASDEVKKQAATATLVQEEAEFNVTYATHVKALNDVKAAYDKKQTDSTLKAKYGAALKDVENDENKFVPVTYTLHFKNDPQGKTGKECSLKDTQVTVYKCIAGQVYHSDERTKSIMRKVPRYTVPGVINDVLKYSNQMDSNRCIRYNKNTNAFDVEFTLKDVGYHDIPSFFPQSCEPVDDAYNITGLPELNLTFLGKDTHMYHATKNDTIETIDAQLRKIDNGEMGESKYYTMPSHRKALITKEFISTEGKCKAAYIEFYKYFKLFKEDAEKPENSVEMQNNILRLKRYELAYNAAKEKNDEQAMLKARSLADIWAHALLDPRKYYLDIENVQYRPAESLDIRLRFLDALSLGILQRDLPKPDASEEKKQQHRELLNSYVKWMENPRDTKIFDKVKAAEIAYNGSVNDFDVYFMNDLNTNHTIY